jgi:hypothetical protein
MMLRDLAFQRQLQLRDFVAQRSLGQLCQNSRIGFAFVDRFQHGASRSSHNVGSHHTQLQIGIFQRLLNAIDNAGALLRQDGPHPGEIVQFAKPTLRNETAAQQSMLQQLGDSLAVLEIRLLAGNRFQMLRIDQQQLELFL